MSAASSRAVASLEAGETRRLAINAICQRRQTLVGRLAEQAVKPDRPDRAEHRSGVAVRQRAADADADAIGGDRDPALQQRAKTLDQRGGPSREIGRCVS